MVLSANKIHVPNLLTAIGNILTVLSIKAYTAKTLKRKRMGAFLRGPLSLRLFFVFWGVTPGSAKGLLLTPCSGSFLIVLD